MTVRKRKRTRKEKEKEKRKKRRKKRKRGLKWSGTPRDGSTFFLQKKSYKKS